MTTVIVSSTVGGQLTIPVLIGNGLSRDCLGTVGGLFWGLLQLMETSGPGSFLVVTFFLCFISLLAFAALWVVGFSVVKDA
ncbi:unnamed protein product, partial [Darwinula stevensoni]